MIGNMNNLNTKNKIPMLDTLKMCAVYYSRFSAFVGIYFNFCLKNINNENVQWYCSAWEHPDNSILSAALPVQFLGLIRMYLPNIGGLSARIFTEFWSLFPKNICNALSWVNKGADNVKNVLIQE